MPVAVGNRWFDVVVVVVDGAVVAVPLAARSIGSLAVDAAFLPRDGDADVVVERVGHVVDVVDSAATDLLER